jgi:hypothetical protein
MQQPANSGIAASAGNCKASHLKRLMAKLNPIRYRSLGQSVNLSRIEESLGMLPVRSGRWLAYFIKDLLHLPGTERPQCLRADIAQRA